MATTYLTRTPGSAGNRKTWTFSAWVKRAAGSLTSNQTIIHGGPANPTATLRFGSESASDAKLNFYVYSGSFTTQVVTNAEYRDTSGWYHIVLAADTTQGTAENRVKLYINGTQVTSFMTATYPAEDFEFSINNNTNQNIGGVTSGGDYFDGLMSHIHFCDGLALAPTVFGSTDATTGEWKINTSPTFTPGTNGFTILKDGNTITDQSTNSNNFTLAGGTLTNTEDCPSDVFANWNPLNNKLSNIPTFINGNTTIQGSGATWQPSSGTLAAKPKIGKFYWEYSQFVSTQMFVGLMASDADFTISTPYSTVGAITYFYSGRKTVDGTETESYFTAISSQTDVVGVALDMTAGTYGEAQFYLNGSTTGAAVALTSNFANKFVTPFAIINGTARYVSINTGNGYFATTAISSAGTNASNIGKFEYDVPTGYTALSTKGLQE